MINVVIADDSPLLRAVLKDSLESTRLINVVAAAENGKEAVLFVKKYKPDILILDCEMPVMHGLDALQEIMRRFPLPVFIFSSYTRKGAEITIKALEYGAVDFLRKPLNSDESIAEIVDELVNKIIRIVLRARAEKELKAKRKEVKQSKVVAEIEAEKVDIIGIGASTGGVTTLINFIPKLPKDTPPILLVVHMPSNFTESFAERLNDLSKVKVKQAVNGEKLERGCCYLAPGDNHLEIKKGVYDILHVFKGDKQAGHRPSCNVLFNSIADFYSKNAIGIILTGMGEDGADGLLRMHRKGALVIGQNEDSCVVYGMPRAAMLRGAVDLEFDLKHIVEAVKKRCGL